MNRRFHRRLLKGRNRGISEVVGAMLLLIVVVVAVGTFAYYLNNLQNQTQNRNQYLQNVKNEDFQITNIQIYPSGFNPPVQYELYKLSNQSVRYYIQFVTPTVADSSGVNLINETTGAAHAATINVNLTSGSTFTVYNAYYNSFNYSATANLNNKTSPWIVTFEPSSTGSYGVRPASWANATLSIRNLNTLSSDLAGIQVNGNWLSNNYYILNSSGIPQKPAYNNTFSLRFPARTTFSLLLHLQYLSIPRTQSLQIILVSKASNYFTTFYGSPTPFVTQNVVTENEIVASRDVPAFDGSKSQSSNGSYIQNYIWQIDVPTATWAGSWSDVGSLATIFEYGQNVQFRPESLFPGLLTGPNAPIITGPFRVTMTAVDGVGLVTTSQSVVFSGDANIAPAGSIMPNATKLSCNNNLPSHNGLKVTVEDIFGRPIGNQPVMFLTPGDVVPTPQSELTSSAGTASTTVGCTIGGVLIVESGTVSPAFITVVN